MRKRTIGIGQVVAIAAWILSTSATVAQQPVRSTAEERGKAVRLARELEADPMSVDAPEKRRWLVVWYERIPDITITVCNLLGPLPEEGHPFFAEVLGQTIFSGGAFMIEHPERAHDQVEVQTAGMEGALRVYERFAEKKPQGRLPFLEDLLAKRKEGTLRSYLSEAVPKACSKQ
jgi:hypothetical protein